MNQRTECRRLRGMGAPIAALVAASLGLSGAGRLSTAPLEASSLGLQNNPPSLGGGSLVTLVEKTPDQLMRALPELAGLDPAASHPPLSEILKRVGQSVEAYFRNFVSTSALEETVQQRLKLNGKVDETFKQKYRYLVISHSGSSPTDLEEYRTDKKGRPAGNTVLRGAVLTLRFSYVPIYLHPDFQSDSNFSYVGQQTMEGHRCYVVGFAQRPDTARLWVKLTEESFSYNVLLEGLAWIDASSYQIIRMYTELLPDASVRDIKEQTTEVTFGEVHFKGIDVVFWLPHDVVVYTDWSGRKFRNYHRYSDYQLYASQTKLIY